MSTWTPAVKTIDDAPYDLANPIREFFPYSEWENAVNVALLESGWNAFALYDTTSPSHPCGSPLGSREGVALSAERSVGYFQINACNLPPDWTWQHLYNGRHNVGTAHKLWVEAGNSWRPWYFSARELGLV